MRKEDTGGVDPPPRECGTCMGGVFGPIDLDGCGLDWERGLQLGERDYRI